MSDRGKKFRLPQDQYLSLSFLSFRRTMWPNAYTANGNRQYFTFWARNAIYHSLTAAGLPPEDEVLVPAYVCRVVPEAVANYGARVVFFHVGRDCYPDLLDLEAKRTTRTRAVIAVHYFGFPQPMQLYHDFCSRHGLFLIEDCAHVLQSKLNGRPLGSFGNASVFSLRKFFPLYDGGRLSLNLANTGLSINWCRESPLLALRVAKDILDQVGAHSTALPVSVLRHLVQSISSSLKFVPSVDMAAIRVEKTDSTFDPSFINYPMSRLSRMILNHSNALAISEKRRENYLFLQRELGKIPVVRFFTEALPTDVCPWVFPLFIEGEVNACAALRELGIPAVTWDGVRPTGLDWRLFADENFLYSSLIFLPIHQNLTVEDLQRIVDAVRQVSSK